MMVSSSFIDAETFVSGVTHGNAILRCGNEDNNSLEPGFFIKKKALTMYLQITANPSCAEKEATLLVPFQYMKF